MKKIPHFINGQSYEGRSSRYADGFNPATGEVVSSIRWPPMKTWRWPSAPPRPPSRLGRNAAAQARPHPLQLQGAAGQASGRLAELITREHGKVFSDAKGEVTRGIEVVEFACGIPHLLKGQYTDQIGGGIDNWSMRQPLGVVAGITPFNFPMMVPCWMFPVAIACGNTFVLKPSERDPRPRCAWPNCCARPACRTACSTWCMATSRRWTR